MPLHAFGGDWTEKKLARLQKYLKAYTKLFAENEKAQFLSTHYVDAFAGTGSRANPDDSGSSTLALFTEQDDRASIQRYYKGSALRALEVEPSFDHYLFVEKREGYADDLRQLLHDFPDKTSRTEIVTGDANIVLQSWCRRMNWKKNRAVVFLDPYGMSVRWESVEILGRAGQGRSGAVDLWVLIPVGQAVNRLLMRDRVPTGAWAERLTLFFGTPDWQEAFYRSRLRPGLFGDIEEFEKQANFESIGEFFINRLKSAFPYVAENSLVLLNSRRNPLFMLCFATSNKTAVGIAEDILGKD